MTSCLQWIMSGHLVALKHHSDRRDWAALRTSSQSRSMVPLAHGKLMRSAVQWALHLWTASPMRMWSVVSDATLTNPYCPKLLSIFSKSAAPLQCRVGCVAHASYVKCDRSSKRAHISNRHSLKSPFTRSPCALLRFVVAFVKLELKSWDSFPASSDNAVYAVLHEFIDIH